MMSTQIQNIEVYCIQKSIRLTRLRKKIICLLDSQNKPLKAYELLAKLNHEQDDKAYAIMSIYRVLDFLCQHRIVHRINSNNSYILCCHPGKHSCQIFICNQCGKKIEFHDQLLQQALTKLAAKSQFTIKQHTIDLSGICQYCLAA